MFVIISVFYYRGSRDGIQPERLNAEGEAPGYEPLALLGRSTFQVVLLLSAAVSWWLSAEIAQPCNRE